MTRPANESTRFPYTTLFRSRSRAVMPLRAASHPGSSRPSSRERAASPRRRRDRPSAVEPDRVGKAEAGQALPQMRSEEHTSELQSRFDLVCRLLLEKKKLIN